MEPQEAPPQPEPEVQQYDVKAGDSLSAIAQEIYGDMNYWQLLYEANRDAIGANPNLIQIGADFVIPPLEELMANYGTEASAGEAGGLKAAAAEDGQIRDAAGWSSDGIPSKLLLGETVPEGSPAPAMIDNPSATALKNAG